MCAHATTSTLDKTSCHLMVLVMLLMVCPFDPGNTPFHRAEGVTMLCQKISTLPGRLFYGTLTDAVMVAVKTIILVLKKLLLINFFSSSANLRF